MYNTLIGPDTMRVNVSNERMSRYMIIRVNVKNELIVINRK